jgi:hypothetical protein
VVLIFEVRNLLDHVLDKTHFPALPRGWLRGPTAGLAEYMDNEPPTRSGYLKGTTERDGRQINPCVRALLVLDEHEH